MARNEHIAIRKEEYVAGGRASPEVGVFTQVHTRRKPSPWGRITVGDVVWMKWSSGPIVARAETKAIKELASCGWAELRKAVGKSYRLYELDAYWNDLAAKGTFNAVVVEVANEVWLEKPIVTSVKNRESWVVVDSAERRNLWFVDGVKVATYRASAPTAPPVPPGLRFEVLRRDGFKCQYCGATPLEDGVKLHADHVVSRKHGGATTLENLKTACATCNLGKGAKSVRS